MLPASAWLSQCHKSLRVAVNFDLIWQFGNYALEIEPKNFQLCVTVSAVYQEANHGNVAKQT